LKTKTLLIRFFVPQALISLVYYLRYRAFVSLRAEVELTRNLTLGKGCSIASFTKIKAADGLLSIGRNVSIGDGCHIGATGKGVVIGDDCIIGPAVQIIGASYKYDRMDIPIRSQGTTNKGTRIGNNVWIGCGACILDGADIGDGVIVTPNTVVSAKVPANSVIQGNPAKLIFTRRD
jgi:acetyltransferase-like isoleucine patch superfamily enzyme